jgi:hypothetical protein
MVSKASLVVRLQTETGSNHGAHMKDPLQLTRGGPSVWRYERVLVPTHSKEVHATHKTK